jgi:hypothetical protein
MKLQTFEGTLGKSNPFTDIELSVHWVDNKLYDDMYVVGTVTRTLAHAQSCWTADPFWDEDMQFFDTEEEAKSWLVVMYKMGGANEPIKRRIRATKR